MKNIIFTLALLTAITATAQRIRLRPMDDKDAHKIISTAITTGVSTAVYCKTKRAGFSLLVGAGASLGVGIIGKELIYDGIMKRGTPSVLDGLADVFGTALGTMVVAVGINVHKVNQHEREYFNNLAPMQPLPLENLGPVAMRKTDVRGHSVPIAIGITSLKNINP